MKLSNIKANEELNLKDIKNFEEAIKQDKLEIGNFEVLFNQEKNFIYE